eukprot:TRINITY_DN19424_c0_g1_i1.p1 TRINITY_DN19424_c0_g1~~TRINITY_DN19424_c0_g1_i1.p1  ORF type:complete len:421 (+),score=70.58 TRINITY_DN19424_c0_g1_i1:59-1264(+)
MGVFDVGEATPWGKVLYSLMRIDASYPNSTSITEEEVALLLLIAVLVLTVSWLCMKSVVRILSGSFGSVIPLAVIVGAASVGFELVNNRLGAYNLSIPRLNAVPEVDGSNATPELFLKTYKGQAVVAHNVLSEEELKLWTPANLAVAFKGNTAAMQMGNVEQGKADYGVFPLHEFYENIENEKWVSEHSSNGSPPYLAEENNILRQGDPAYMEHISDIFERTLVRRNDSRFHFTDTWIWAGPKGSKTGLHMDWDPTNLLHQLYGKKTIWLFHPSDTKYCYPSEKYDLGATIAEVDPFNPDLSKYPEYSKAAAYKVDLVPGDVIQVPAGWMHYVSCETTACISLSGRSFDFGQTITSLPGIAGAVLHRFGLYGGGSTSGYLETSVLKRVSNVSWYRAGEEYN